MGAHPFLTLTLFIAMFERDHPEPLVVPEGLRRRPGPPVAALPRHRHLSRARRDPDRPRPATRGRSTAPDPVAAAGRAARRRHRRADHAARPALRVGHLLLRRPRRCPTSRACRRSASCATGPRSSSAGGCGSPPPPGWRPATAGWPSSRWRPRPRPCASRPTSPTPWSRRSACRPSRRGRCSRAAPHCAPGRPVLVLGRRRGRGPGGRAGGAPPRRRPRRRRVPARRRAASGPPACGADAVVDLRPDDDVAALAERLREACEGAVDVVVDPLAGIPGIGGGPVLARRRSPGQPRQQRRAGPVGRLRGPAQPVGGRARLHQQRPHRPPPTGGVRHGPRPRGGRTARGEPTTVVPLRRGAGRLGRRRRGTRADTGSSSPPDARCGTARPRTPTGPHHGGGAAPSGQAVDLSDAASASPCRSGRSPAP